MALAIARRRLASQLARTLGSVRHIQGSSDANQAQPKAVPLSKLKDSFLDGTSSTYLEELEGERCLPPSGLSQTSRGACPGALASWARGPACHGRDGGGKGLPGCSLGGRS
jgi:hypothetical protein